jgi:hypothetical protein
MKTTLIQAAEKAMNTGNTVTVAEKRRLTAFIADCENVVLAEPEIIGMVGDLSKALNKPILLVLEGMEELQYIAQGEEFLELLRTFLQIQRKVQVILVVSSHRKALSWFQESGVFGGFGSLIPLQYPSTEEWIPWLQQQFAQTGKTLGLEACKTLVTLAEKRSSVLIQLAGMALRLSHKTCTKAMVEMAWAELLSQKDSEFHQLCRGLTETQYQMALALAQGHTQLSSIAVMKAYDFGTQGNIRRLKESLESKGIADFSTETPFLCNPLLGSWLRLQQIPA